MRLKGQTQTKPPAELQDQVSIRTWSQWDEVEEPGHVQMDLVGHNGEHNRGEFALTLTVTDYLFQWAERRAVKNRSQR